MNCTISPHYELDDYNQTPPMPEAVKYREMTGENSTLETPLASESALAISYNGISHAVMMVTPGHFEDFVRGFSLTSGIVESFGEIRDIDVLGDG